MIQSRVGHTLLILQNCAAEAERHFVFDSSADTMLKHLLPFTKSSDPSVSFDAKVVLLPLGPYLKESDLKYLLFTKDQMKQTVSALNSAIANHQTVLQLYETTCSILEVIVWLEKASLIEGNVDLMINYGLLEIFPAVMRMENHDAAIKGAMLMWKIVCFDKMKKAVQQCSDIISFLKSSPKFEIVKYILHCIEPSEGMP